MALTTTLAPTRTPTSTSTTSTWTLTPSNLRYGLPLPVQSPTAHFTTTVLGLRFKVSRILKLTLGTVIGVLGIIATWWALDLAMWTAAKDYWDHCKERKQLTGQESEGCEKVLAKELAEPPTWRSYFQKLPNPFEPSYRRLERRTIVYHDEDGEPGVEVEVTPETWHDIDPLEKWYLFGDACAYKRDEWIERGDGVDALDRGALESSASQNVTVLAGFRRTYVLQRASFWEKVARLFGVQSAYKERTRLADLLREGEQNLNMTLGGRLETPRLHRPRQDDPHEVEAKEADDWAKFEIEETSQHDELDDESRPDGRSSGPPVHVGRPSRPPRNTLFSMGRRRRPHEIMVEELLDQAECHTITGSRCLASPCNRDGIRYQSNSAIMYGGMESSLAGCTYMWNYTSHATEDLLTGLTWWRAHPVGDDKACWNYAGYEAEQHDLFYDEYGIAPRPNCSPSSRLWRSFSEHYWRYDGAALEDWKSWQQDLQWRYNDRVSIEHIEQGSMEYLNIRVNVSKAVGHRRGSPCSPRTPVKNVYLGMGPLTIFDGPEWVFWQNMWQLIGTIVFSLFLVWFVEVPLGMRERRKREIVREKRSRRKEEKRRRKKERSKSDKIDGSDDGGWVMLKVEAQKTEAKLKLS